MLLSNKHVLETKSIHTIYETLYSNKYHKIKKQNKQEGIWVEKIIPSEALFFRGSWACFPDDVEGTTRRSLSFPLNPREVDGEDFSRCLSSASFILFRSKLPATSPFETTYPRSLLYISLSRARYRSRSRLAQSQLNPVYAPWKERGVDRE